MNLIPVETSNERGARGCGYILLGLLGLAIVVFGVFSISDWIMEYPSLRNQDLSWTERFYRAYYYYVLGVPIKGMWSWDVPISVKVLCSVLFAGVFLSSPYLAGRIYFIFKTRSLKYNSEWDFHNMFGEGVMIVLAISLFPLLVFYVPQVLSGIYHLLTAK